LDDRTLHHQERNRFFAGSGSLGDGSWESSLPKTMAEYRERQADPEKWEAKHPVEPLPPDLARSMRESNITGGSTK
jgi:hypothetical protein